MLVSINNKIFTTQGSCHLLPFGCHRGKGTIKDHHDDINHITLSKYVEKMNE